MSEHLIGHFQTDSTFDRLDRDYFWRKMKDQIAHVIKQCEVCARNEREKILSHPARAIPISGIFDRVGCDLVFGLPESGEGYVGIIVFTDAFTKFPYAKPIRTKSAIEIAQRLKEYICLFGCMKVLLTDFGREFNNELISTMLSNIGVEHKSTTSFNPRCNGLTERLNLTLVTALRKHAESNQNDWPAWLDWVLFAYRTRVHSSTNFCPYH